MGEEWIASHKARQATNHPCQRNNHMTLLDDKAPHLQEQMLIVKLVKIDNAICLDFILHLWNLEMSGSVYHVITYQYIGRQVSVGQRTRFSDTMKPLLFMLYGG
jgi:hypothetical protein